MDGEKLVKLLKEHFPTKTEHDLLSEKIDGLTKTFATKKDFLMLKEEMIKSFNDVTGSQKVMSNNIEVILADINEIKPSVKALDKLLEKHPADRIDRLEKHIGLPTFSPTMAEDEG